MTMRDSEGRFVSPTNEVLDEMEQQGSRDIVYVEAQHVQVGMMALHMGKPMNASGWLRIVRVERIYKGICLHFESGAHMQRDLDATIFLDAVDLPTAFALAKYGTPRQSLGKPSLRILDVMEAITKNPVP